jgi:hypothetical protein
MNNQTKHKTKTKHKLILKAAKCKRTRKMKGGWNPFKKTAAAAPVAPSQSGDGPIKSSDVIKASATVAAITTLGSIARNYLANPAAITTIGGLVTASTFGAGGLVVVTLLVAAAAWRVIKEKQKAYKGLILVMDELYLVIQKLNGIVEISMHIAAAYGFPIDTRDVQLALDAILAKFDELLDPTTGYDEIKNELSNPNKLRSTFNAAESEVNDELANASEVDDATDKPTITLWTRVTKFIKKNIIFSAPKFVQELNEAVTYLALYVGIFSASFSTTYTTVALQLLVNDKKEELKDLQTRVFGDNKFISMVEGAFVYPLLQSKKTYDTCMLKTDANNSKCDAIFNTTAENVRNGMLKSFKEENVVTGELFNKMTNLKAAVAKYETQILNANEATTFAKAVKDAFDADKSSVMLTQSSVSSATPSNTSAPQSSVSSANATPSSPSNTSATPSNDVQSVVQNATQSSVKPSPNALSAPPSSATPSSATPSSDVQSVVQSAPPTQSSATPTQSSAMPSNTSSPSNTSATPSATNATIPSETNTINAKNAKNANLNNMPVMKQPPKAVAQPSEVALSPAAGGG